jgi:protein-S-isoprenylcysteine O-methyltransferase Ste14
VFAELIRFLIAAACALFVLSLPLSKTESGSTLRRWAGVCFILAFLPSLIVGLFYPPSSADAGAAPPGAVAASPAHDLLSGLGCIAAVVIAAFIAYGVLKLRSRFASKAKPRDPWETFFSRGGGKRPFTMHANARRSRGPFSFDDEEDD